ncbi:MAG: response regulator transcription factor [Eubacterium sp.]|nr:response regulator transcription factor [Eubacterium sp.]
MRILIVEDEKRMADAERELLRQENYEVDTFYNGQEGLDAYLSGIYDAAILDVMLPGINGFDIVSQGRQAGIKTPTLLLTAKTSLDDKVTGLDSGADDYLTKPFQVEELLARVRALCRRNVNTADGSLSAGDLVLDTQTSTLSCTTTGQEVRLSEKEFHILEYFIANQGQIVSREQLALKIWGYENDAEYNNVEVYISFTRKKLKFIGAKSQIKAVRGMGYELRG